MSSAASGIKYDYEVHAYINGDWQTVANHQVQAEAVAEAKQISQGRRYAAVRVIREHFDEAQNLYMQQVVHQWTKADNARYSARQVPAREAPRHSQDEPMRRRRPRRRPPPQKTSKGFAFALGIAARLLLITAGGLGVLYWIFTNY